jgi:hypothetical protein
MPDAGERDHDPCAARVEASRDDADMTTRAITDELHKSRDEAENQRAESARWKDRFNQWRWWLGGPPIALSSLAGLSAAIGWPDLITACVAFASAIVAGAQALVQPERRSNRYGLLEADFADLARDTRELEIHVLGGMADREALAKLVEINNRRHALDQRAGQTWDEARV